MTKNPFIGQMDRVIEIVEKTMIIDSLGAETLVQTNVCSPYAFMQDISGGEETDGKIKHMINRTYTIRFQEQVKQKANALIVIDGGQRFEVLHVIEIGRRKHLELRVKIYE